MTVSDPRNEHKLIDMADIKWRYNPNGKKKEDKSFVFLGDLMTMKPADVPSVKEGCWIIDSDGYYVQCSVCMTTPKSGAMTKYCPECGAKMDL